MRQNKLEPKRMTFVHADEQSESSMVLVEARASGAVGMTVTAPLLLHDVNSRADAHRPLSEAAQKIYDTMKI
jgi:tRNA1(Val) A37 N6-methylase TrmN6